MLKLSGIFAALPTPFDWEGNLYPVKAQHNVARWNRLALAGYVVGGRAGEAAELSLEEQQRLLELVKEAADPARVLIAGVGAESLREAVALSKTAAGLGYQAVLAEPTGREASSLYFRALGDRSALPVIIAGAGVDVAVAASQHPNVTAVVVPGEVGALKEKLRAGVQLLTGSAANLARHLQDGASAAMLSYAAAAPYSTITIWEAVRTREADAAADWQKRIAAAVEVVESKHGVAGLKHAMDVNGYYGGPPRLPLAPLTPAAKAEIEAAFDGLHG